MEGELFGLELGKTDALDGISVSQLRYEDIIKSCFWTNKGALFAA